MLNTPHRHKLSETAELFTTNLARTHFCSIVQIYTLLLFSSLRLCTLYMCVFFSCARSKQSIRKSYNQRCSFVFLCTCFNAALWLNLFIVLLLSEIQTRFVEPKIAKTILEAKKSHMMIVSELFMFKPSVERAAPKELAEKKPFNSNQIVFYF